MAIQAVVFDRDGVLVDFDLEAAAAFFHPLLPVSLQEVTALWRAYGQKVGFPRNLQQERAFWEGIWRYVAEELNLTPEVEAQLQRFDYTGILYPYPDARPALEWCRQQGLRTAVLSNFSLASIEASLQATGLAELVDVAAAATVIGAAKPSPAAYKFVIDQLGVRPESCLLLDNKSEHVAGARKVGMQALLIDRSREGHDLEAGVMVDLSALARFLG